MARRTVCAIPAATSGEQNSPEDHPRARPLDPIDSAGGRAGTCENIAGLAAVAELEICLTRLRGFGGTFGGRTAPVNGQS